jgi:hypothetical protein
MFTPKTITKFVVAGLVLFGGYKFATAMNDSARLTVAKANCKDFAKERNAFTGKGEVRAVEAWTKHDGRFAVVALIQSEPFETKICVQSNYSLSIVSRLEEPFWY